MLKSINASLAVLSITTGLLSTVALTISPAVSAKTLVTCGAQRLPQCSLAMLLKAVSLAFTLRLLHLSDLMSKI